jgi:two-component system, chemotaxis family, protein-glutamate methylesterase/glutaminase
VRGSTSRIRNGGERGEHPPPSDRRPRTPLDPAHLYVAPPGRHVLLRRDETLALIDSGAYPPHRPSADLLLVSLAIVVDGRAIAVVLSGKGNDGATGATAIHDFGGVVIAADEASSKEFSMPSATIGRSDAVDHVVHVDDIAALLESITRSRDPSDTL